MYKRILCPVDGSETSNYGVLEAINLAKNQGAKLKFFHVIDTYVPVADGLGSLPHANVSEILLENAEIVLKKVTQQAKEKDVEVDSQVAEMLGGIPANEIVKEAKAWAADLIVMGTHGLRGFNRMVMGSDAENVVRASSVPVMLLNASKIA